ncbi:MAG: C13 family peptidase [Sphingomonadaceae bacterium]|nr:C13 family peptidase [Sphingomonadaceae bacterium]
MNRRLASWLVALLIVALPGEAFAGKAAFGEWAAAVVAGDWRGANGLRIDAFDNARRDLADALVGAGFDAANIRQFSPDIRQGVHDATPDGLSKHWFELTKQAPAGCLLYVTSHGTPGKIVMGKRELKPRDIDFMLDFTCADRPTVVVLSACYSGSFIPALAHANRLVVTASRSDRSSFGCGSGFDYPVFDACVLKALPKASDFTALAHATQSCVSAREKAEKLTPPSEPQVSMGEDVAKLISRLSLKPD